MNITKIAKMVEGVVEGDAAIDVTGMRGVEDAGPGDLTFAIDEEKLACAEKGKASCVLTGHSARRSAKTLIRVANPKLAFLIVYNALNIPRSWGSFVDPSAAVADPSRFGKNVWIGAHVSIEEGVVIGDGSVIESNSVIKKGCVIGPSCHIYPNVTLYENVRLGKNVTLHSGAVIGSDGFGYVSDKGKAYKFPQLGRVIIEDDVEIGSNTTIDRGSLNDTVIGAGSKIDNLCQIAHNVRIGKNALIAAQCGISGSTSVGDNVKMGGQSGIVDNVVIGDNVTIGAKSAVIGSVKSDSVVWGFPARNIARTKKQMAALSWLGKNLKALSAKIKQ